VLITMTAFLRVPGGPVGVMVVCIAAVALAVAATTSAAIRSSRVPHHGW
jgi:hypothetical protein